MFSYWELYPVVSVLLICSFTNHTRPCIRIKCVYNVLYCAINPMKNISNILGSVEHAWCKDLCVW